MSYETDERIAIQQEGSNVKIEQKIVYPVDDEKSSKESEARS